MHSEGVGVGKQGLSNDRKHVLSINTSTPKIVSYKGSGILYTRQKDNLLVILICTKTKTFISNSLEQDPS